MSEHQPDTTVGGSSEPSPGSDHPDPGTDVHPWVRVGTAVLGGTLLVLGLRRRSAGGTAMALVGGWLGYRSLGGRGRLQKQLGEITGGRSDRRETGASAVPVTISESITVGSPASELSEYLRDPETLNRITPDVVEVTARGEDRQRWTVQGPLDRELSLETRVVEDRDGDRLRWETVDGSTLSGDGSVTFRPAPGDRGTQVTLRIHLDPPGGTVGTAALDRLDVVPAALASTALDRFKSLVETGTVRTLEGNPSARGRGGLL